MNENVNAALAAVTVQDIPRSEWNTFLDAFSVQHEGWLVNVEEMSKDNGIRMIAENLPLRGLTADLKDRKDILNVSLGTDAQLVHEIDAPQQLRLLTRGSSHEALEIQAEGGRITVVRFRVTAAPETVDGIWQP
jgi:hypothetical protein